MIKSTYSKRRRMIQTLSVLMLLSIPFRFFCIALNEECMHVFGLTFGLATMFYPLFTLVALLVFVVGIGMKKGRLFCSHLCPMHLFLEKIPPHKNKTANSRSLKVWLWAVLFSALLTQVILSFFQPLDHQLQLIASGHLPILGIIIALFCGFMFLFVGYQENFCKKGCPYALLQMLLQSDQTRTMQFGNPEKTCTNCHGCDDICPVNLRPRFESNTPDCTNCNLCAEACTTELGAGNTLFHLIDPGPVVMRTSNPRK